MSNVSLDVFKRLCADHGVAERVAEAFVDLTGFGFEPLQDFYFAIASEAAVESLIASVKLPSGELAPQHESSPRGMACVEAGGGGEGLDPG